MTLFLPMFIIGLVSSVHCVAMCGSMVLTYAVKDDTQGSFLKRMTPHFAYHAAKILSYVLVGLALGALGSALNLAGIRGWVTVGAGMFMVMLGLQMTGRFPALARFSPRPPKVLMRALMKLRKKANADDAAGESSMATPVMFGLLTGLMPCGPLQGAQLAAAGAGSAANGAIAMLGFGLGTMPLMLGFGAVSGMLSAKFKTRMMVVAAVLVMGLGLVMLNRGAMLLGSPVTFDTVKASVLGGPVVASNAGGSAQYKTGADGVVEIPLTIKNTQFVPQTLSIPADKPVRLIVNRQEENACSAQLAVPQIGVLKDLKANGTTVVDLPATKGGTYTLTCGMGMMSGQLVVGGAPGTSTASSPVGELGLLPMLGLVALGGLGASFYVRRRRQEKEEEERRAAHPHRKGDSSRPRSGARPGSHADEPAVVTYFGFTKQEIVTVAAAAAVAVMAGFTLGGGLR